MDFIVERENLPQKLYVLETLPSLRGVRIPLLVGIYRTMEEATKRKAAEENKYKWKVPHQIREIEAQL